MGANASKTAFTTLKNCTLWKSDRSPPCRAVMMALDAMELSVTEVDVNLDKRDNQRPELIVRNPLQTLPVFQDHEMVLHDSHAICTYLASRYCIGEPGAQLYPKDPWGRAIVNQQMFYNCGVLYPRYRAAVDPIINDNSKIVMPQQICDIECAYADLEKLLGRRPWFGGSRPTLGDITIGATVSSLHCLVPIDPERFPLLSTWICRLAEEYFYVTGNKKGLCDLIQRIGELSYIKQT